MIRDAEKLVAGVVIALIPMVAYAAPYFITFSHAVAVLTMGGAAVAELTVACCVLKRSQKNWVLLLFTYALARASEKRGILEPRKVRIFQ